MCASIHWKMVLPLQVFVCTGIKLSLKGQNKWFAVEEKRGTWNHFVRGTQLYFGRLPISLSKTLSVGEFG